MALTVAVKGKNFVGYTNGYVKLLNCRVSFPHLAVKQEPQGEGKAAYSVTGMMPLETHAEAAAYVVEQIRKCLDAKKLKAGPKNWFLYNADKRNEQLIAEDEDPLRPEYLGHYIFTARDTKIRPQVRNRRGELVQDRDEIEEMIYGGCYCHIMIQPWAYNNLEHKKKGCSSSIIGIQFVEAGESFGTVRDDDTDEWGDESDGESSPSKKSSAVEEDDDF